MCYTKRVNNLCKQEELYNFYAIYKRNSDKYFIRQLSSLF